MMNPSIQETLKTQIIGRINEEFNLNAADNIYFNEFVLQ
jgi:flagellar basal body-associated protein FliL